MLSDSVRRDFLLLISSRIATRIGDGFLRILAVLLVAEKSKDPMIAALVLVFRYVCETLINAISGPFIDRVQIRTSLVLSDLIRAILSILLVIAAFRGYPYAVYLVLSFLGDFVFIFFKPAVDKVVKVSFPIREGTKALSAVDAANHVSNITGYTLASVAASLMGLKAAALIAPALFLISCVLVSRLRLAGEKIIDYRRVRTKSYWASQREGLRYTWESTPLRFILIGRSLVAVGRGGFTALSVVYLADIAKGLSAYGYFESAQSSGKVIATALLIPIFFAYRSTFFLMMLSEILIGLSFFGFNLVNDTVLACIVGAILGVGQASEAVGIDSGINRYADAHIQGRAKSTTSFGSRVVGLSAIALAYFMVSNLHFQARNLFAWLGIFPILGALVFLVAWTREKSGEIKKTEESGKVEEPYVA